MMRLNASNHDTRLRQTNQEIHHDRFLRVNSSIGFKSSIEKQVVNEPYDDTLFSGIYAPQLTINAPSLETFSGAWLVSKLRFLRSPRKYPIENITNIEGAIFTIILSPTSWQMMTRDFFDFQVVHLSSMTNEMPSLKFTIKFQEYLLMMMYSTCKELRRELNLNYNKRSRQKYRTKTVAVIPFSSTPGTQKIIVKSELKQFLNFTREIRQLYLEATVLSVYRYFQKVIITVGSKDDYEYVKGLSLPIWNCIDLSNFMTEDMYGRRMLLPKYSLLYVKNKLNGMDMTSMLELNQWRNIEYIYYTEADQILYTRDLQKLFEVFDSLYGVYSLIPHRMHTMPLPRAFPGLEDSPGWRGWSKKRVAAIRHQGYELEDVLRPRGSCCDAGRFIFRKCEEDRWFKCHNYGLHNFSQWLRFGAMGYTMPTATVHAAKCEYFKERVLCPLPKDCAKRFPSPQGWKEFCDEYPIAINVP